MNFLSTDKSYYLADFKKFPKSTVAEYYEALKNKADNSAGKAIDAGKEPYLFDTDSFELCLHPLVTVWDIGVTVEAGDIYTLIKAGRDIKVPGNTILIWN